MRTWNLTRTRLIALLGVQLLFCAASPLWAQSALTPTAPSLGLTRNEPGCPALQVCDVKALNLDVPAASRRGLLAPEEDFVYAHDFAGKTPANTNRMFDLAGGEVIARVGPHLSARFAPEGKSLKLWRGTVAVAVRF